MHWSLDDWEQYAYLPSPPIGSVIESPRKVLEMWRAELDAMRRLRSLFNLCLHPFLTGRPSRLEALRELIEHAQSYDDIHFTRCGDLAAAAAADPTLEPRIPPTVNASPAIYPG